MITKKLIAIAAGIALTTAAMANPGLTLSGSGLPANIGVTCNGTTLSSNYDIPANGTLQPSPMPWNLVHLLFKLQSTGTCNFFLDNASKAPVGTATLTINGNTSAAQVVSYQPYSGYKVTMTTSNPAGSYYGNVVGTLSVG